MSTQSKSQRVFKFRYWNGKNMYENVGFHPHEAHNRGLEPESGYSEFEEGSLTYAPFLSGTLMQFTGLLDKNGKEIYEQDIMALTDPSGKRIFTYVVKFEDAKFVLYHTVKQYGKWGDLHRAFDPDFHKYNFCVVGNIYENPELLNP